MSGEEAVGVYVDKFYEFDPEFDVLMFGTELRDGMVVLVESSMLRADPLNAFSAADSYGRYERDRCREVNRWAEVSRFEIVPRDGHEPLIRFVAVYADGDQRVRSYSSNYAWIVKRDSVGAS